MVLIYELDTEGLKKLSGGGVVETGKEDGMYKLTGSKEMIDRFVLTNLNSIFDAKKVTVAHLISGEFPIEKE